MRAMEKKQELAKKQVSEEPVPPVIQERILQECSTEECSNTTSDASGLCQDCYNEYCVTCYKCNKRQTVWSSKLCGTCFAQKLFKCKSCPTKIGQPGRCGPCHQAAKKPCTGCQEITTNDSGLCKKCTPRTCETCHSEIERGRLCTPCYQLSQGKKLCSTANCENYTKDDLCNWCNHEAEGHQICKACNYYYSEFKSGICKSCFQKKLFCCEICQDPLGAPGTCRACRDFQKQQYTHAPKQCEFFTEVHGKKVFCQKMTIIGKFCKECNQSIKTYTV
jgi:hypothetical protein